MMRRTRSVYYVLVAVILLAIAAVFVFSLRYGAVSADYREIWQQLQSRSGTIYELRLPRILCAFLVGINMAMAGYIMQAVLRNPLASPDVIGVTTGGATVTVVLILTAPLLPAVWLPFFSLGGSLVASALIFALGYRRRGSYSIIRLALTGIAVGSVLQAVIKLLIVKYAMSASQALVWTKGSLYARSMKHFAILWPWTAVGVIAVLAILRYIRIAKLEEELQTSMGVKVVKVQLTLIGTSLLLAASAASIAGNLSFIGLVVPHLASKLGGGNTGRSLLLAALLGALIAMLGDGIGRVLIPPMEIPVGIVTAMIGAPYLIYLIINQSRHQTK